MDACLQKTETGYELIFAKAMAHEPSPKRLSQPSIDFGDYVYVSQCFSVAELPLIITEQHPTFTMGPYEFALKDASLRAFGMGKLPSNNIVSEWPTDIFELRPNTHTNYLNPKTLVAHNAAAVFRDQYEGIQRYMRVKISYNYNNGWIGAMLFILPDYRVRIHEIASDPQCLTVKLMKNAAPTDLRLRGLVEGSGSRQELCEHIGGSQVEAKLQSPIDPADSISLYITAPEGIVDYYDQNPMHHSGQIRWLSGSTQPDPEASCDEFLKEIMRGEGPNLEFKPYIRIAQGEPKRAELAETAIAFANTNGGTIVLGVSDTGQIEGIERDLYNRKKTASLIEAGTAYAQEIRKMMNEITSRRLDLYIEPIQIAGHTLLRIDVRELPFENKPVWKMDTKDTWIRRGATNFRPDPETIRDEFARRPSDPQMFGLGQPGDDC